MRHIRSISVIVFLLAVVPLVAQTSDCDAGPQIAVTGDTTLDPAVVAKEIAALKAYVTPELNHVLADAAADPVTWDRAMRNPTAFLREKGFPLPDNTTATLLVSTHEPPANGPKTVYDPSQCPDGMMPITVERKVKVCDHMVEFWKCFFFQDGSHFCILVRECAGQWRWEIQMVTYCGIDIQVAH